MQSTDSLAGDRARFSPKERHALNLKRFLLGCGAVCLIGIGSCLGGIWYLGHKSKEALDGYLGDRQEARSKVEALNTPGNIPSWVPKYPGTSPAEVFTNVDLENGGGFFRTEIGHSIPAIVRFYDAELTASGFTVEILNADAGQVAQLVATESASTRTIAISLSKRGDEVSAVVRYLW